MSGSQTKIDLQEKDENILIEEPALDPFADENSDTGKTSREILEQNETSQDKKDEEKKIETESTTFSLPQQNVTQSNEYSAAGETQVHILNKETTESSLHDTLVIPQTIPKESALSSLESDQEKAEEKKEEAKPKTEKDPFVTVGLSDTIIPPKEEKESLSDLLKSLSKKESAETQKNDTSKEVSHVTPPLPQKAQKQADVVSKPPVLPKKESTKPPELPKHLKTAENDLAKRLEQKNSSSSDNWLFKKDGYVFGPVPPAEIIEKMYQLEIMADTFVSKTMGSWQAIKEIDQFSIHLEKIAKIEEQKKKEEFERQQKRQQLVKKTSKLGLIAGSSISLIAIVFFSVQWFVNSGEGKALAVLLQGEKIDFKKIDLTNIEDIEDIEEESEEEENPSLVKKAHRPKPKNPTKPKPQSKSTSGEMDLDSWKSQESETNRSLLTDSEIEATLARNFFRIKKCLIKAYQEQLDIPARFEIDFAVMNSGKVGEVKFNRKKLTGAPTGDCIISALRSMSFREYIGETRNVTYPIEIGN